jgi:hypothetical protein
MNEELDTFDLCTQSEAWLGLEPISTKQHSGYAEASRVIRKFQDGLWDVETEYLCDVWEGIIKAGEHNE